MKNMFVTDLSKAKIKRVIKLFIILSNLLLFELMLLYVSKIIVQPVETQN